MDIMSTTGFALTICTIYQEISNVHNLSVSQQHIPIALLHTSELEKTLRIGRENILYGRQNIGIGIAPCNGTCCLGDF